jgi:hypothetical protein
MGEKVAPPQEIAANKLFSLSGLIRNLPAESVLSILRPVAR